MLPRCFLILAVFAPLSAGWATTVDAGSPTKTELARYAKACNHYVNRTRFVSRDEQADFFVTLAEVCQKAQTELKLAAIPQSAAAEAFLEHLADLRETIVQINMDRLFGDNWTRHSRPKDKGTARTASFGQVSPTGEYLIAYRMGLVAALDAWIISHRDVSLTSAIDGGGKPTP